MTQRIINTINTFLEALAEGKLQKGHCSHCAVGNLCRKALTLHGESSWIERGASDESWSDLFLTEDNGVQHCPDGISRSQREIAQYVIGLTEFTEEELMQIENLFEISTKINYDIAGMYTPQQIRTDQMNGLIAVLELICEWDNVDLFQIDELFITQAELIPC